MKETWLQTNRRAIWFGSALPLMMAALGAWLAIRPSVAWRAAGAALLVAAALVIAALVRQLLRPRIAYRDGEVLFNLRSGEPIAVPVHIVEAFFLGQAPAKLPGDSQQSKKTVTLVARLAQRYQEWAQRDVKPAFGDWKEGYVTVRGTWCEPLTNDVVRRINQRLKEVKTLTEQVPADAPTR
jgi:hypothetical protein